MKLGALKTAIRNSTKPIQIYGAQVCGPGKGGHVTIQKTAYLELLDEAYPEGRSAETGLKLRDDGVIDFEAKP